MILPPGTHCSRLSRNGSHMSTNTASIPFRWRLVNSVRKYSSSVSFLRSFPNHNGSAVSRWHTTVRNLSREDVGRLQIAVHDSDAVRFGERVGGLVSIPQGGGDCDGATAEDPVQRFSAHVFHYDEVGAVDFVDVVDDDDVGMVQGGGRARLLKKTKAALAVAVLSRRQNLNGDGALQAHI